jgi:arylsulfatase
VSDPFLVHWPKGIKSKGHVRNQFVHAIDMTPTVLECLEIDAPEQLHGVTQSPMEGASFKYSFDEGKATSKHDTQYFEMFGHRSIYHKGWRAVCPFPGPSFQEARVELGTPITEEMLRELDAKHWELYNVDEDPAETKNLAEQERGRLIEMSALWYVEAGKFKVFPIDSRLTLRLLDERPQLTRDRKKYTYFPHTSTVPEKICATVLNRPHTITANLEIPKGGAEGVILAMGSGTGGYALFIQDRTLHYTYNYVASQEFLISSRVAIPEGLVEVQFKFAPTAKPDVHNGKGSPGNVELHVNGKLVGEGKLPVTDPLIFSLGGGLTVGRATGSPITSRFKNPFAFTGTINKVVVDVSGDLIVDKESEMRTVLAHQ